MCAAPLSLTLGAPLSALILKVGWLGWPGWRWMFVLEGLPAIVAVLFTLRWLIDHPREAQWLEPEERKWIEAKLESEKAAKRSLGHFNIGEGLRQPKVWLLAVAYFLGNVGGYGFVLWLPSIIQRSSGLSVVVSNLCSSIPFGLAVVSALLFSRSSDRKGERRIHTCLPLLLAGLFLLLSALPGQSFWLLSSGCRSRQWGLTAGLRLSGLFRR